MSAYYGQISKWGLRCQMYQGYDEVEDEDGSASDILKKKSFIKLSKQQKNKFNKRMWPYGQKHTHTHTQVKSPPSDPCAFYQT